MAELRLGAHRVLAALGILAVRQAVCRDNQQLMTRTILISSLPLFPCKDPTHTYFDIIRVVSAGVSMVQVKTSQTPVRTLTQRERSEEGRRRGKELLEERPNERPGVTERASKLSRRRRRRRRCQRRWQIYLARPLLPSPPPSRLRAQTCQVVLPLNRRVAASTQLYSFLPATFFGFLSSSAFQYLEANLLCRSLKGALLCRGGDEKVHVCF